MGLSELGGGDSTRTSNASHTGLAVYVAEQWPMLKTDEHDEMSLFKRRLFTNRAGAKDRIMQGSIEGN